MGVYAGHLRIINFYQLLQLGSMPLDCLIRKSSIMVALEFQGCPSRYKELLIRKYSKSQINDNSNLKERGKDRDRNKEID